ncbi:hypothetical protein ACFY0F_33425 [Streptomyces sp. NPDC001544]|uniref:hypothetical protein n=1 Tax=Streptomyces sp. NPDC001544 TaxID=3364584 RepID=UPI0036CDFEFF
MGARAGSPQVRAAGPGAGVEEGGSGAEEDGPDVGADGFGVVRPPDSGTPPAPGEVGPGPCPEPDGSLRPPGAAPLVEGAPLFRPVVLLPSLAVPSSGTSVTASVGPAPVADVPGVPPTGPTAA